jgi:hypothetical protein
MNKKTKGTATPLVDGEPITISWIPHVKDISGSHLELILTRVEKVVREVLVGCVNDSNMGIDSDSTGSSTG